MAADGTSIKNEIDNDLANKGYRGIRIASIITTLKKVVDWVTGAVNGNLSTWLKTSDNQPGGANTDSVYRAGLTEFRGGVTSKVLSPATTPMSNVASNSSALQVIGSANGGAAFMEFYVQGVDFQQFGVDLDGKLKYRPLSGAALEVVIDKLTAQFRLASTTGTKKLSLYDISGNDHQFYGFGVLAGALRYQISNNSDAHTFYAGSSAMTSVELARFQGNGLCDFIFSGRFRGTVPPTSGAGVEIHYGITTANSGTIICYDRSVSTYKDLYIDALNLLLNAGNGGKVGVGTATPSASLHVKSANGYDQFRLENKYTPSGPNDSNGQPGAYAWDDTWFYIKTTAGWRRLQLQGW